MAAADVRKGAARLAGWIERQAQDFAPSLRALFVPLDNLLIDGGDARLDISPGDRLNRYNCRPFPHPDALSFSSSTATSISGRAYVAATRARKRLLESAIAHGIAEAFDARLEEMRDELLASLGIRDAGLEIVFSPSGTDAQLHALFLARLLLGPEVTSVVIGADQTGSGTTFTARGRHFSTCTSQGAATERGAPIEGLGEAAHSIEIALHAPDGAPLRIDEIDARVTETVAAAIASGRRVLLQAMDSSKFGRRGPSDVCLDAIAARWPNDVQIVLDACQMRISRARLGRALGRGFMVLVTGSKFFAGPPFSGALFVPAVLSEKFENIDPAAGGLYAYTTRYDWPTAWPALRNRFSLLPNFGQWLRWEAALAEMKAYYAVPSDFRREALRQFASAVPRMFVAASRLELLDPVDAHILPPDDEMAAPTIFSFLVRENGAYAPPAAVAKLYAAMARDASDLIAPDAAERERALASRLCLVGQPVAYRRNGADTAALRVSASARLVSECWSPDRAAARANVDRALDNLATVIAKADLLAARLGTFEQEPTP